MRKIGLMLILISIVSAGCYYDVQEELHPSSESFAGCDTINVTFALSVMPIFEANCFGCHGPGITSGGVSLATHAGVKSAADDGSLLGSIEWLPGFTKMPQNLPQLSECQITIIKKWIENGSQNN